MKQVYIASVPSGQVKIGISQNPANRRRQLQNGHHERVTIAHAIDVGDSPQLVERHAHQILAAHRLSGEWFGVTPDQALAAVRQAVELVESGVNLVSLPKPRIPTDATRAASASYHAKRKADGMKKSTFWLTPEAHAVLASMVSAHGSKDAAINFLLNGT